MTDCLVECDDETHLEIFKYSIMKSQTETCHSCKKSHTIHSQEEMESISDQFHKSVIRIECSCGHWVPFKVLAYIKVDKQ